MHRIALGIVLVSACAISVSAQQPASPAVGGPVPGATAGAAARQPTPTRTHTPLVLPGTPDAAFSTIQGNALDSIGQGLPDSPVRIRDARLGRIVGSHLTDKSGLFVFRTIEPGSYVVELVSAENRVLAASEMVSVNAGDTATAIVKLPFRVPPFGGLFGRNAAQALTIISAAAATGVLTQAATADVSPEPRRP